MKASKIGVIADDFTGACDAASFLKKAGQKVALYTKVPRILNRDADAYVIALKTRSISSQEAIEDTLEALSVLKNESIQTVYFKFCSTFDSTPKGNIGPVCDALMEKMQVPYTILAPSLPINGRIVQDGLLYVNGVLLHESPLKDHPLNPMWSSDIATLMKPQSKYPCHKITMDSLDDKKLEMWKKESSHFYLIPDYVTDHDGQKIASYFRGYPLLTGGSGLLEHLPERKETKTQHQRIQCTKSIILCGSCSKRSKEQIEYFKKHQGKTIALSAKDILEKRFDLNTITPVLEKTNQTLLIYSDAIEKNMSTLRQDKNFYKYAKAIENFMAQLAEYCVEHHFDRLIIAGGETSGAVLKKLGYSDFVVGSSIAPGVPSLFPKDKKIPVFILKSGNFGQLDFFERALGDVYV